MLYCYCIDVYCIALLLLLSLYFYTSFQNRRRILLDALYFIATVIVLRCIVMFIVLLLCLGPNISFANRMRRILLDVLYCIVLYCYCIVIMLLFYCIVLSLLLYCLTIFHFITGGGYCSRWVPDYITHVYDHIRLETEE